MLTGAVSIIALMSQCTTLGIRVVDDRFILHAQVCQYTEQGGRVYGERRATLIIDTHSKKAARVTGFLSFE